MNLEAAMAQTELGRERAVTEPKTQNRSGIAKMVFDMAASQGEPYQNISAEDWARRWLPSQGFVLVEIRPGQVAVPYVNRITGEKIQSLLAQSEEQIQPIVVDLNRLGIGKTNGGYTPKIIVVDGKHRHRAQVLRGKDTIKAWVGELALQELRMREQNRKPLEMKARGEGATTFYSRGDSTNQLYAAIAPPASAMTRQDTGDGGPRGRMAARGGGLGGGSGMNPARQGVYGATMARSTGQLEGDDPSDTKVPPDPSDTGTFVDPSDRRKWNAKDPQLCAPGCTIDHEHMFGIPGKDAPGAGGSYTRKIDKGATNSEFSNPSLLKAMMMPSSMPRGGMSEGGGGFRTGGGGPVRGLPGHVGSRINAGPIRVKKIVTRDKKKKRMEAVAPKGWEGTVRKMKDHPEITNPYALSYYMKDKGDKSHFTEDGKKK